MAKRGKAQARRNGSRSGPPAWAWLLAGLVIGVGLAAYALVYQGIDPGKLLPKPNPKAQAPREPEPPVAQQATLERERRPKYDFYTVLPEREVVISDAELSEKAKAESTPPAAAGERLLLQAAAFRAAADAEQVKAQLALFGHIATIQTDQIKGETWHRVRLGPYASVRELDAVKSQLAANGMQAIAIREPRQ